MVTHIFPVTSLPVYTVVDWDGNGAKQVAINPLSVIAVEEVPQKDRSVNVLLSGGVVYRVTLKTVDEVSAELGAWLHQYSGK
jgi:hypothetical protein